MKIRNCLLLLMLLASCAGAQTYTQQIKSYRDKYRKEFLEDKNSPLTAADTGYLRFFAANERYKVVARLVLTPDSKPFEIATHSGKTKTYRKYGVLHFTIKDTAATLEVYQSLALMKNQEYADYLFIPFTDLSNYETTYAGGRYIDLKLGDIKDGKLTLDFNKCYNPYCAYKDGYSCPIPPDANKLPVAIEAGEQMFGKAHE